MSMLDRPQIDPVITASDVLVTQFDEKVLGIVPSFSMNVTTDLWVPGSTQAQMFFPTTASVINIASDDVNDTIDGTGARTVTVFGCDINGVRLIETVAMNGVSTVQTTNLFFRVDNAVVTSSGTTVSSIAGANIGVITINHDGESLLLGQIDFTDNIPSGQLFNSHRTIPTGFRGYITSVAATVDVNANAKVFLMSRDNKVANSPLLVLGIFGGIDNPTILDFSITPLVIQSFSDVWFAVRSGSNNTLVEVNYNMILRKI